MGSIEEKPKKWIRPSTSYEVPDITLNDPANRKLRVISIGGGFAGIMMAHKVQQECENVEFVVYERNPRPGGTWFENRYPGCACDVPSHAYTFPWAPNSDWPRFLAPSNDILKYIDKVVDRCDLAKYIKCNHQVAGCYWNEETGKWKVKVQIVEPKADWSSTLPLKVLSEFEDEADILQHATGILNRWDWPEIPGLHDFKGRVLHTAGWPDNYGEEQWKGQTVAVLGSGASSIQLVPAMQPHVKHIDVFVRTPVWFIQILDNFGNNHEYSEEDRSFYRNNPYKLLEHIKHVEDQMNTGWNHNLLGTEEQKILAEATEKRMRQMIKDDKLLEGFLPKFAVNCRRITPGDPYMEAIQKPNVSVHFTAVGSVTPDGVVGEDGIERKCDTVVCATGFDLSFKPRFPVVGKNGINLQDKWKDAAEAYFGVACADMPNWICHIGPNWPVAQGSWWIESNKPIMGALDASGDYAIQCIHKVQNENLHSFCPKQEASDAYNEHTQTWATKTVWGKGCRTWYYDVETGRNRAVYAGSSVHYREMLKLVRWEDMDIVYRNKLNRYAFMGIGRHLCQTEEGKHLEKSNYCIPAKVDPRMFDVEAPGIGTKVKV